MKEENENNENTEKIIHWTIFIDAQCLWVHICSIFFSFFLLKKYDWFNDFSWYAVCIVVLCIGCTYNSL